MISLLQFCLLGTALALYLGILRKPKLVKSQGWPIKGLGARGSDY